MHRKAFTLIEVLLVAAILAIVTTTLFTQYLLSLRAKQTEIATDQIVSTLNLAATYARNNKMGSAWGVETVGNTSYQLIYGTSSAPQTDSTILLPEGITVSPFTVWFDKGTANTQAQSIMLTNNEVVKEIHVSEIGNIELFEED